MEIYKTRQVAKWAKKEKISDAALAKAVSEMERGLIEAVLGGHVYTHSTSRREASFSILPKQTN